MGEGKNRGPGRYLRRIKNCLMSMRLTSKLVGIMVLFVFIPLLIIGGLVFWQINDNEIASATDLRRVNLSNICGSVDMMLKGYESQLDDFYRNEELLKTTFANEKPTADMAGADKIRTMLNHLRKRGEYIDSITLAFPDRSMLNSQLSTYLVEYDRILQYNEQNIELFTSGMHSSEARAYWRASMTDYGGEKFAAAMITCNKNVKNIYAKNELIGTMIMHISALALDEIEVLKNYNSGDELLAIIDGEGRLTWCSGDIPEVEAMLEGGLLDKLSAEAPMEMNQYEFEGREYYFLYTTSEYSGWKYVNLLPESVINSKNIIFMQFFTAVMLLIVIFIVICVLMVNRSIVKPIQRMIVSMSDVDGLEKVLHTLPVDRHDEIGYLYNTYNTMNRRIDNLVRQLKEYYERDKNQEIRLLQSQLNPHFIYNTLESISWMTYSQGMPEVSKVLTSLSRILRYSVKNSGEYVTFGEELEKLKSYIYIQRFRFEDRFDVEYEIDESLLNYKTIKFIFQPFVENALLHGLKNMESGGIIKVKMERDGIDVLIEISDNGCGMDDEQAQRILGTESAGIGIANIDKTLKLKFGSKYCLRIESREGEGTLIRLRVPVLK